MSIAYRALVPVEALRAARGKRLDEIKWRPVDEAAADSGLAFDHAGLIQSAAEATRGEIEGLELPFGFLPEEFTLGQLQSCCEALLGRDLDKSSFRRRLEERDCLEAVPGKFLRGPQRPAQFYRASS